MDSEDMIAHLKFIYGRMVYMHSENPNLDYMSTFSVIIDHLSTLPTLETPPETKNTLVLGQECLTPEGLGRIMYINENIDGDVEQVKVSLYADTGVLESTYSIEDIKLIPFKTV